MDSVISRINIIFCSFIVSLACCAAGNFASSFIYRGAPIGNVELHSILDLGISPYLRNDQANIALNIDVELSKYVNWNTNQVFAFVYTSYENSRKQNFVTVWDDIFSRNTNRTSYSTKGIINKYPIRDFGRNLRNKKMVLNIAFCYMPVVGSIKYRHFKMLKGENLPVNYFQYK
ncbi:putative signal peptidase subunit [Cryptosporidium canis]|uniref:Signal peptidase complex subunit 3 n=1 Tax=Cryptosporidium canis TaxID=195482 RepID=A0ABQ8P9W5_9CRYT|nr:putative signal peptidase subunit [Cryptosporidium canis]KAJ1613955.1 putative signal peptidase subunit [Cryptosporidium canis]